MKCVVTGEERQDYPEEFVRQAIARELMQRYGYRREHMCLELPIQMGSSRDKRADIAIFRPETDRAQLTQHNAYIIIECKRADVSDSGFESAKEQLKSYMTVCDNCHFGMVVAGNRRVCYREIKQDGHFERVEIPDIPAAMIPRPRFTVVDSSPQQHRLDSGPYVPLGRAHGPPPVYGAQSHGPPAKPAGVSSGPRVPVGQMLAGQMSGPPPVYGAQGYHLPARPGGVSFGVLIAAIIAGLGILAVFAVVAAFAIFSSSDGGRSSSGSPAFSPAGPAQPTSARPADGRRGRVALPRGGGFAALRSHATQYGSRVGDGGNVVKEVSPGEWVELLGVDDAGVWCQVRYQGTVGYIYHTLLQPSCR